MSLRKAAFLGASMAALFVAPAAMAQVEKTDAATPDDGTDIVVTARRVEERLQDIPVAVTAVTADQLSDMSIRELRDLSAVAPNLNIKTSSNDGQSALVSIRGQVPAGVLLTTDSAVGVYVDGFNNPRAIGFRGALVDVARVEVLRGPQGTLYGRNTTGGAISVITKSPTDTWEGSAALRLGNHATANAVAVLNVPLGSGAGLRFVAQRGVHDGYGKDFNGRDLADENSTYLRGKLKVETGPLTVEAYADYQRSNNGGPIFRLSGLTQYTTPIGASVTREVAAELGLPQTPAGWAAAVQALQPYIYHRGDGKSAYRSGLSNTSYSNFTGQSAGLDLTLELSDQLSLRSLTGYRHSKRRNFQDLDSTPFAILVTPYRVDDDFYSEEVQLLGNFGPLNFVLGGFYSHEKGYETSAPGATAALNAAAGRPLYSTQGGFVTSDSLAGFVQANWHVTDRLTFTAGARYTVDQKDLLAVSHTNQAFVGMPLPIGTTAGCSLPAALLDAPGSCRATFKKKFSDPSWLGSVDYKITDDILAYAKVARGFRAGGQNLRGLTVFALTTPFGPETITEYEVGLKSDFFDRALRLNIAAFHDNYQGVQRTVSIFSGATTNSLVSNAAQAKIDGVEVEATLRPVKGLTLSGNIAYTNARYVTFIDSTGDRSKEDWPTPDITYSISARYEVPVSIGTFALQADYQGQSAQNLYPAVARQPADVTQPAYGLLNGRISLKIDSQNLEISVFGRNLLDKVYAEGGLSTEGLGANFVNIGEPRIVGIELVKSF